MFNPKDVYNWLTIANQKPSTELCIALIEEEFQELKEAVATNNIEEIKDAVTDLKWVTHNLTYAFDIPLQDMAIKDESVKISNFSKFCKTEEEAIETVKLYASGNHPDKPGKVIQTSYIESNGFWIILSEAGKILKSYKYQKA